MGSASVIASPAYSERSGGGQSSPSILSHRRTGEPPDPSSSSFTPGLNSVVVLFARDPADQNRKVHRQPDFWPWSAGLLLQSAPYRSRLSGLRGEQRTALCRRS
jgi:hypothetical protein